MQEHRIKTSGKRMEMTESFQDPPVVNIVEGHSYAGHSVAAGVAEAVTIADVGPGYLEPPVVDIVDPRAWRLMEDAPLDGTLIEVKADPDDSDDKAVQVVWRKTSRRDGPSRRWVPRNFWSHSVSREELAFEPFCWRLPEGFILPGMISA